MEQILIQEKKVNEKGYVLINVNNEWVLEHRYIMENYLGRVIKKEEKVHHDNEIKTDNRIENLTLFPTGSRHNHFHRQVLQFGMTRPRLREIQVLKEIMKKEHDMSMEVIQ